MTFIAFFRDPAITLTTDQIVLGASEVQPANNIIEIATQLSKHQKEKKEQINFSTSEAYKESYAKGLAEGIKAGQEKTAMELVEMLAIAHSQRLDLQKSVANLAIQVVKKMAGDIGASEMVSGLAHTAARDLVTGTSAKLWVHSNVVAQVTKRLKSSDSLIEGKRLHIDVRSNNSLEKFDCILDTDFGQIIASLDDQLQRLEMVLTEGLATEVEQ